jgi:hypothetical protein
VTEATARGFLTFHRGDDGGTPAYSDARKRFASEAGRVLAITLRRPNRQCGNVAFWHGADIKLRPLSGR